MNRIFTYLSFSLIVIFGTFATEVQAQDVKKGDLQGIVVDENEEPLISATLMLLSAADSVLIGFSTSEADGGFKINNVKAGDYLLKLNFLGYTPKYVEVSVGSTDVVDLGSIPMQLASEVLGEIEVTADYVPIEISKDTIGYNADAFQTQPNAAVEDLLKKLPGVEVDADGNITAQGEEVQNVLVDGKEFFGSDPKIATKNLPADAIKKVQVFDRKSDNAEFSGVDDGQTQKTINLKLKDNKMKGVFGNVEAGYGTDNRYLAKATINQFSKKSQLSLLGLANNINQQGFSVNEFVNFSGGMSNLRGGGGRIGGNSTVPISNGLSNGLARTLAGGVNYNVELGKKLDLRTNYFFNGIDNEVTQDRFRQDFVNDTLGNSGTIESFTNSENRTKSNGHRVNVNLEYDIDSTQNLRFRSKTAFGDGSYESNDETETYNTTGALGNRSRSIYSSESDNFSFEGSLLYRKKFGSKVGRILTLDAGLSDSKNDTDGNLESFNEFFESGRDNAIDQRQQQDIKNQSWNAGASYTEPIGTGKWIKVDYEYEDNTNTSDKAFFDRDTTGEETLDSLLSTFFERDLDFHRAGATFQLNTSELTFSAGLQYQLTNLNGFINNSETPITRNIGSLLPELRFRYDLATSKSIRFNYDTDINVPSLEQLSPIVDNTDPLRIYIGNPDLEEEYTHSSVLRFISFSQFSNTSIFAQIRGTYTTDKIINSSFINSDLIEVTTPVNIDSDWRLTAYGSFSTPLKFMRSRIRVNGNSTYNRTQVFINRVNNNVDRWNHKIGLSFQSLNSDVFEYTVGADWTYNTTAYSENSSIDQNFFIQHYYTDLSVNFLKTWSITTSFDVRFFTGEQFQGDETLPLWEASLSKYVFSDRRGEIKLTVFDILNENRGISRTANANYLEEIQSNSLSQYFMLSFIYSMKGFGQAQRAPSWMQRRNK